MLTLLLLLSLVSHSQESSDSLDRKTLRNYAIVGGAGYATGLVILNQAWYKNFERESFHFFNDSKEWKQMDKMGHSWSSFQITRGSYRLFRRAGMSESKSFIYGSLVSFAALTPIEWMDGYSSAYGASISDMLANLSGSVIYGVNVFGFKEDVIHFKYSFTRTNYPEQRPEVLGENLLQELLKDYNGQTYWLTFSINKIHKSVPQWLHLAVGYGAQDMLFANDSANESIGFDPYRQFYVGLDVHLPSLIKSRKRWVNTLVNLIGIVHIPSPAIELSRMGTKLRIR